MYSQAFSLLLTTLLLLKVSCSEFDSEAVKLDNLNKAMEEQHYLNEYKQFEKDLETGLFHSKSNSNVPSRSKRFVILNTKTHFDVALLLGIPMQAALPVMSNKFNIRRRRNIESQDMFEDHPVVQPHLDKVESYFNLINIPDRACQLRAVCEFSSDPERYYPISDLVLTRIRNPTLHATVAEESDFSVPYSDLNEQYGPEKNISEIGSDPAFLSTNKKSPLKPPSLFSAYNKAADYGQAYGEKSCSQMFRKKCKYSMKQLLNMPVLQYWNVLSSLLKMSLKDTPV